MSTNDGTVRTFYLDDVEIYQDGYYAAEITSGKQYWPFGMEVEEYSWGRANGTRHGFNGQEADDEIKGAGNAYDFGGRSIYDGRIARFISADPDERMYPGQATYVFAADNPIYNVDKDGRGPLYFGSLNLVPRKPKNYMWDFLNDRGWQIEKEKAALRVLYPDSWDITIHWMATYNVAMGDIHTFLDIVGMIPGAGELADAANGAIYYLEGDTENATWSFAATIPVVGSYATLGKYGKKLLQVHKVVTSAKGYKMTLLLKKNADKLWEFGSRVKLGTVIGRIKGYEAHHIIPWELRYNDVIQKAADKGFHMNDAINGINLKKYVKAAKDGLHGNHPAYNTWVENQLKDFAKKYGSNLTPEAAKNYLENELIPTLKKHIEKVEASGGGENLNEYFKILNDKAKTASDI